MALSTGTLVGCASPGPLESRRTMMGALKGQNAQLEHERAQLEREIAELKSENRRIEDQLVQEEQANDELATRLSNAQTLLSRNGMDTTVTPRTPADDDGFDSRRTAPASRPRRERKAPFAEIPGQVNAVPYPERDSSGSDDEEPPRLKRSSLDTNAQSRRDRPGQWLPIASGLSESNGSVR
jgi:hypothetical protein